jgi:IclR family acetate operon transcriptional repressor
LNYGIPVSANLVDRLLAIVDALADAPSGMPLHAIAAAVDIPKSAAHRLLADLVRNGYARQDGGTGRYLLTTRLVSLGFRHLAATGVVDLAQPVLDALAASTGELVRLGIVDGDRQTWVAKAQGARSGLRYDPDMGSEAPLASTASGQAWLACLTDEEAVALVMKQGFGHDEARGPNAPRTVKALLERLAQARRRGFSMVIESSAPGTSALAAAIRHPASGRVVGVVSIAGPSVRLTEARMRSLAPQLLAAAAELADACDGSAYLARAASPSGRGAAAARDGSR